MSRTINYTTATSAIHDKEKVNKRLSNSNKVNVQSVI